MDAEEPKIRGVVTEVGLERDEDHFRSFNLKIGVLVKAGRSLSYEEGERMMGRLQRELLGREVEVTAVMVRCPDCGKGFNSEQGMRQHMRIMHAKKKARTKRRVAKTKKPKSKK